jgi:hypothetical protein
MELTSLTSDCNLRMQAVADTASVEHQEDSLVFVRRVQLLNTVVVV